MPTTDTTTTTTADTTTEQVSSNTTVRRSRLRRLAAAVAAGGALAGALFVVAPAPATAAVAVYLPCTTETPAPTVNTYYSSYYGTASYLGISGKHYCTQTTAVAIVSHQIVVSADMYVNGSWVPVNDTYLYSGWSNRSFSISNSASMRCRMMSTYRYIRSKVWSQTTYLDIASGVTRTTSGSWTSGYISTRCWAAY